MMYNSLIETYKSKGIPLSEVLNYLSVSEKTYLDWASFGNIPASALVKLSEIFNCSVDNLLDIQQE